MGIVYFTKRGKIFTTIIALAILSIGGAAAVYSNDPTVFNFHSKTVDENPLMSTLSTNEQDTSFRDKRLTEAQGVDNIVNNVLSGAVQPGRGIDRLVTIELYAKSCLL